MVPGYNDPWHPTKAVEPSSSASISSSNLPLPSMARLVLSNHSVAQKITTKPLPITWTPQTLLHFLEAFLLPLHASTIFDSISIRFSGPKPDPFIALNDPPALSRHRHVLHTLNLSHLTQEASAPVRPECGDHIRIYLDAAYALGFRSWLNGVELDSNVAGKGQGQRRVFEGCRLALIGEQGEVLVVA